MLGISYHNSHWNSTLSTNNDRYQKIESLKEKKSNKKWKVQDDKYVHLPATSSIDVEDADPELINKP